jgi:hypothetical protein
MTDKILLYRGDNLIVDDNVVIDSFDANDVNIGTTLTVNNVAPGPNKFLGTDGANQLGFYTAPTAFGARSIYYVLQPQDINSAASYDIQFGFGINQLVGQINRTSSTVFTVLTAGTYLIEFALTITLPSTSENLITITVNTFPFARSYFFSSSSFGSATTIMSLNVGNTISVTSTRMGDASPKNVIPYSSSGQIMFTRLA